MLDDLGACQSPFLGHVADEEDSRSDGLAEARDFHAAVTNLGHRSCHGSEFVGSQRLEGIYDRNLGFLRLEDAHYFLEFCFTENVDSTQLQSQPFRPLADLACALLSGDIKDFAPGRTGGHYLKQQGGLSYARFSTDQDRAGSHDPSAQNPVKFGDSALESELGVVRNVGQCLG